MLPSIESSRMVLAKAAIAVSGFNTMTVGLFMFPMFSELPIRSILVCMVVVGLMSIPLGGYIKYRAVFGTSYGCFAIVYFLFVLEFLCGGGSTILAVHVAKRFDLKGMALGICSLSMLVALLIGIYREMQVFKLFNKNNAQFWQEELGRYIDYQRYSINPNFSTDVPTTGTKLTTVITIVMVGSANIPLLFELYGGGKANVIFLAAPLGVVTFSYLNLCKFGPWIVKLYLLRILEKASGRRFMNADYEQIQALRRTFFLSRWLMKDYASPSIVTSAQQMQQRRRERR